MTMHPVRLNRKHILGAVACVSLAASLVCTTSAASAQATTKHTEDAPQTADDAFRKKDNSYVHNPTERNKTYPNQNKEQPQQTRPRSPMNGPKVVGHSDKTPVTGETPRNVTPDQGNHVPG